MKKSLMAVLFALMLVLAACGGGSNDANNNDAGNTNTGNNNTEENAGNENDSNDNGDAEGGTVDASAAEEVYKKSCASCHAQDLTGGAGPNLTKVGSEYSADEIATIIEEGLPGMPGGLISGDDEQLVADWLADHK